MKIEAQFFSRLRDAAGTSQITLDLPEASTVADLISKLYTDYPALAGWDQSLLVAVGLEFADRTQVLQEGDEVSVMPPVQGG